jgi:hypothetical protein
MCQTELKCVSSVAIEKKNSFSSLVRDQDVVGRATAQGNAILFFLMDLMTLPMESEVVSWTVIFGVRNLFESPWEEFHYIFIFPI